MTRLASQKALQLFQALKLIIPVMNVHLTLRAMLKTRHLHLTFRAIPKGQDIGDLIKLYCMTQNTPSKLRILFNKLSKITQTQLVTSYMTLPNVT